jgi:hypothetical protein
MYGLYSPYICRLYVCYIIVIFKFLATLEKNKLMNFIGE